jgi:FKBP-type peptidyl-prolyl cis-trans isomerase SlyD
MKVGKDKVVTLTYELRNKDDKGEVIQKVDDTRPFIHLFGNGTLLPAFEENLSGLQAEEEFSFHLNAGEAYGNRTDDAILMLKKELFEIDGKIDDAIVAVGKMITMQDENGNPVDGFVLEIKDDSILMDFNHPLAGEDLYFSGKIAEIRDATEEELSHKHVHGEGGHHH